jgi:hypothetical protein
MKRIILLLSIITFAGLWFTTAANPSPKPAAAGPGCTKSGNDGNNVLAGGRGHDVLCGLGGKDYVFGDGGNDGLRGGTGNDVLTGALGHDTVKGNTGRDRIFIVDSLGGELAAGGPGKDRCYVDPDDRTTGCEMIFVSYNQNLVSGLESLGFGVARIAEGTTPTPTPPPATTSPPPGVITVTITVTAPPVSINGGCTPGPPQPPPFCG